MWTNREMQSYINSNSKQFKLPELLTEQETTPRSADQVWTITCPFIFLPILDMSNYEGWCNKYINKAKRYFGP